jgi:hypothetical protein
MKKTKIVTRQVEEVDTIICNKCGEESKSSAYAGALTDATVCAGYDSSHLDDGAMYSFDLCEKCVVELMKTFKHSAFVSCKFCNDTQHLSVQNLHVCSNDEN